jgi:hypothetical protein
MDFTDPAEPVRLDQSIRRVVSELATSMTLWERPGHGLRIMRVALFAEVSGSEAEPGGHRAAKAALIDHPLNSMYRALFASLAALTTLVNRIGGIVLVNTLPAPAVEWHPTLVASKEP